MIVGRTAMVSAWPESRLTVPSLTVKLPPWKKVGALKLIVPPPALTKPEVWPMPKRLLTLRVAPVST